MIVTAHRKGRPTRTRAELVRSRAWYCAIERAAAWYWTDVAEWSPETLEELFAGLSDEEREGLPSARTLRRSKEGKHFPQVSTVEAVERILPGTREVLDCGPAASHLWTALGDEPELALVRIQRDWENGVVIRHGVEGGDSPRYLVLPQPLAARYGLSNDGGFPAVDARDLLQWQSIDEYLGLWTRNGLPGRRALPIGPQTPAARSVIPTVRTFGGSKDIVVLPPIVGLSYDIARAIGWHESAVVDVDLLADYGIALQEFREAFPSVFGHAQSA